ncbi:MAG: NUDIX domain-containing protein [Rhodospirillales bacterium]
MADNSKAGPSVRAVPPGDDRERLVCPDCGYVAYDNPRVIVGAVCAWRQKFLICRRAIPPRKGFWTIPAGYLEIGETTAEGAKREAWEEARAKIEIVGLIGIYEIPRISQVYVMHRAELISPDIAAGPESDEVTLAAWDDIPWEALAFPSVAWALERFHQGLGPGIAEAPETAPRLR